MTIYTSPLPSSQVDAATAALGLIPAANGSGGYTWATAASIAGPGAWTTPTLATGVVTLSGAAPIASCVDGFGCVRLRGGITNSSGSTIGAGVALLTLPVGSRPAHTLVFPAYYVNNSTVFWVQIASSGVVGPGAGLGLVNGNSIYLDGIAFLTTA